MRRLSPPGAEQLLELLALGDASLRQVRRAVETEVDAWELLIGHDAVDGRSLSGESVRIQYLHLTDRLIAAVTGGGFDRVLFLDKSARPVCWLMRHAWPILAPDYSRPADVVAPPRCSFLNIDRLQWRSLLDPQGVGMFDASQLPAEPIDGLNRCFRPHPDSPSTWLDGQRVLVVDEVRVSGDTGAIAEKLLSRAFPNASFTAYQWMTPKLVTRNQNRYNNQLPVWYRDDTELGRGIGDRDPQATLAHRSARTRAGAWFLSRPLKSQDPLSERLRLELRALIGSLIRGETALVPAHDRDDYDERCSTLNGVTPAELRQYREERNIALDV